MRCIDGETKMTIIIRYIRDAGVLNKERLVLKVEKEDDVGYYMVFDTAFVDENKVSTNVKHTFWFPDKKVHTGDMVVLYTKSGVIVEKKNDDNTASHFFYWGLEKTIWGEKDDTAVLLEVKSWQAKRATELVEDTGHLN